MTRDEAVKMLQATRLMLTDGANQPISDLYYALDMAIEALEQTEPQYEMGMGTLKCDNCSEYGSFKCTKCDGEMYFKDEPQTYITEDRDTQILDAWQVHHRNTTSVEDEPQMAEDIVRSFGFKVESYRQAKAKDEPQTDCPQSNICGKPCKECGACEEECGLWKKLSCPSRATEEQEELNL